MSARKSFLTPVEGYARGVGLCVDAMDEVREQLRAAIQDLPDDLISKPAVPGAHSIGAIVLHIGEAEWWWMHCVIGANQFREEDRPAACWDALIKESRGEEFALRGLSAHDCLAAVDEVRSTTTRPVLAALGDEDLERVCTYKWRDTSRDVGLRWVLHHLVDHEAQHKGQILMLKRLLG